MSIFSDYAVGALSDWEFKQEGIAMNNRDKWEQEQESRRFYEDDPEEHEDE